MPNNLCFTVRFLQPYCHARRDGGELEWPPSPLRLFQALVAAAAARWNERQRLDQAVPVLQWLEEQPHPVMVAPNGVSSDVRCQFYVPDNTADLLVPAWKKGEIDKQPKRTEKVVRPTQLIGEAVHYLYPLPRECPHLEILKATARSVTHLGWGIDMVAADAAVISETDAAKLAGERWLPIQTPHTPMLRVPREGTLDELIRKHDAFLHRLVRDAHGNESFNPVPPLSAFRLVGYRRATDVSSRHFAAFAFYRPDGERRRSFSPLRAIAVAGMVRHLAAQMARQNEHHDPGRHLDDWVNDYVLGHGNGDGLRPRFSYLPLATMRPPSILGGINRVLIAEPPGGAGNHAAWARQVLRGQILVNNEQREEAILMPATDDWVLQRYVGKSATWATVTPVVLPGSDDGKFAKAEKLFCKALRHAGYSTDAIADLDFRNVSYWPGGELALKFHRPDYLRKDSWTVYHIRLRWKQAIPGPIAIGAGRHCGLGVFAALNGG